VVVNFIVNGPFEVPSGREGPNGAYFVDEKRLRDLIESSHETICKPGCYVFACSSSRGSIPVYVGKAKSNILTEAFNDRNIKNLNRYMNSRRRGKLQIFAIHQQRIHHGEGNKDVIAEIEEFLIGHASRRNPGLLNIHGTGPTRWVIEGFANHKGGRPEAAVVAFKGMLGIVAKRTGKAEATIVPDDTQETTDNVESAAAADSEAQKTD
jgi:hypothetical protein